MPTAAEPPDQQTLGQTAALLRPLLADAERVVAALDARLLAVAALPDAQRQLGESRRRWERRVRVTKDALAVVEEALAER